MITEFAKKLRILSRVNAFNKLRLAQAMCSLPIDYRSATGRSHSLLNVTLELTYRCNCRCAFCFAPPHAGQNELSLDEISALVDSVAARRVSFYLTGGEPLVRKDCVDIIKKIASRKLKVGINTNLIAADDAQLLDLAGSGLTYAIVSLHGPKPIHEKLTRVAKYDRVIQNLIFLKKNAPNIRLLINTVITPENLPYLPEMVDLAAELNIDAITFQHETYLTPADKEKHVHQWHQLFGGASEPVMIDHEADSPRIDVAELANVLKKVKDRARTQKPIVFLYDSNLENWYDEYFQLPVGGRCSYLYTDARITPHGDVIYCQSIPKSLGNIRNTPLLEIWNSPDYCAFRNAIKKAGGFLPACARCCKLYRSF